MRQSCNVANAIFFVKFQSLPRKKAGKKWKMDFSLLLLSSHFRKKGKGASAQEKKSGKRSVCKKLSTSGKTSLTAVENRRRWKTRFFFHFSSLVPENLLGFCEEETNKNSNINTFTYFLVPLHSHNSLREKITFKALTTFKSLLLRYDRDDDAVFAFGANLLSCHIDKEKSSTKIGERLKLLLYFSVTLIYSYMP